MEIQYEMCPLAGEIEGLACPVAEKWHLFFWHKPPFEEKFLELRQHFQLTVGQFIHALRTSFLVLITENYESRHTSTP